MVIYPGMIPHMEQAFHKLMEQVKQISEKCDTAERPTIGSIQFREVHTKNTQAGHERVNLQATTTITTKRYLHVDVYPA